MTKDVLLSIRGLQFVAQNGDEPEAEPVELITTGDYYKKDGKHYITYDEAVEEFNGSIRNIIQVTEDSLDITKKGFANVHMVFERNRKNVSYYNTPFGSILIGIDAKSVDIDETEDNIDVKVSYNLEVNYEHLANCSILMNIRSKDSGGFTLQS